MTNNIFNVRKHICAIDRYLLRHDWKKVYGYKIIFIDLSSFTCLLMMLYICKIVITLILMLDEFVKVCQISVCFWVNLLVTMYTL